MACQIPEYSSMKRGVETDLGYVARTRQVDSVITDRMRGRAGGKHHHPIGQ